MSTSTRQPKSRKGRRYGNIIYPKQGRLYDNFVTDIAHDMDKRMDNRMENMYDDRTAEMRRRIYEMEQDRVINGAGDNAYAVTRGGASKSKRKSAGSKTARKVYKASSKKSPKKAAKKAGSKRKPSEYNLFVKKHIKAGGDMKSAAKAWRAYKKKHHIKPKVKKTVKKTKKAGSKTSKRKVGSGMSKRSHKSKSKRIHKSKRSHK